MDYPISTKDEANAIAKGLSSDLSSEFVEAGGICRGDPRIKAGIRIKLKGLGDRYSGAYFVTAATHIFSARGYETHFSVSGRQPNTFTHLLRNGNGGGSGRGLVNGVVVGIVTNLEDKLKLGRVQISYPWLIDKDDVETASAWARVATPMAGQDTKGVYFIPEINDEVLVAFEHGDMNRPYIIGTLWNNVDKPPEPSDKAVVGGKVVHRIIRSRLGHEICFDDSDDKASIFIVDKTGKNSIFIDSNKNSMDIKVDGDLTIVAGGKIDITSKLDTKLTVGAAMDVAVKANLTVKANGTATVQSISNFVLKSSTNMTIEAGITTEVKGSLINVGTGTTGTTTITGMLVKIN
ncbi:MAG: hypothetical protein HC802_06120 [Caldilineaceae bacterium]|nr:hypothetical protein [Caldilineaceae bacterium]